MAEAERRVEQGHEAIVRDILTIVGGSFTPDGVSPEVYDATRRRVARMRVVIWVFSSRCFWD